MRRRSLKYIWRYTDPIRLRFTLLGAIERLESRWPTNVITSTGSDDGTETKELRHKAHTEKVLATFRFWKEYENYRMDFEAASSSDPVLLNLR